MKKIYTLLLLCFSISLLAQKNKKPNILFILSDDVGWSDVSLYNQGIRGYKTPNIDRIGKEGIMFTDAYAQATCTAGRAAIITGQSPYRTGLLKVGLPGSEQGLSQKDVTIASLLKDEGYNTGQFGKNHLGDLDRHLPTMHGFDEFFGILYHLNAMEEPEEPNYPKSKAFRDKFGPRNVLHTYAQGKSQKIEDNGPLTKKRMEKFDNEVLDHAIKFMDKAQKEGKPFFTWLNSSRMHNYTHLPEEYDGKTSLGLFPDGMTQHDDIVGLVLDYLDKNNLTENTIVVYSTDNGPQYVAWPDGGSTPFRGEKGTCFEGGFRVPLVVRWPAQLPKGKVINDIISHEDWLPTLMAAVGKDNVKEELKKGKEVNGRSYKNYIDGYNMLPLFKGETKESPRKEFIYFSDDGDLAAIRYNRYKLHFAINDNTGIDVWQKPYVTLRSPLLFDLRVDPWERTDKTGGHEQWSGHMMYVMVPIQAFVGEFLATFKEYPQRQPIGSFTIDKVLEQMQSKPGN